jgi:prepilin-type N-terminal cleavage/methylation domain-containing protein
MRRLLVRMVSDRWRPPAFTLFELLVVVGVIAVLSTASWRVITNDLHRSRINAVGMDFASWVESIRKAAKNTQGGCEITVANLSEAADGAQLASVQNNPSFHDDAPCAKGRSTFLFRATAMNERLSSQATAAVILFTPRGTILGANAQALPDQVEVRLALKSINNLRCIRLSGLLGALQIGSHSTTSDVGVSCTAYARF